jgi:hypothetical protein
MSQPDFYAIFGVSPSASQEEIRTAHRELVKRYHPDIYSTSGDKARATEKLQAINQAYAVLGNPERRKQYDARRLEQARSAQRVAQVRQAQVRRGRSAARPKAPPRSVRGRRKFQWKKFFTFPRLAGTVAGVMLFMLMAYWLNSEPRTLPAWILVQKTDLEPAASKSSGAAGGWEQLGTFGLRGECAHNLKYHVKQDQEQGSHAFFDEASGTVAITVLLSEAGSALNPKELLAGEKGVTKRVRHYECRAVQIRQPDSWLRRKLRQAGLVR